ncbi:MAG TPA: cytochrome c3 family protein [Anaerolineales bacterium]|nr:cytochrome c3 family protein [Anaerolineales bacterium]
MKRRPLGCLTTGGLIAFVVTLIVVGTSFAITRSRLFSPGRLNAQASGREIGGVSSHADLEMDCAACHPAPWDAARMADLCADCHQEVLAELANLNSLHGAVMAEMDELNCRQCHTEHHGETASLTRFLEGDFPHELLGYSLQAHSRVTWEREIVCKDCHQSGFTSFEVANCTSCHEQLSPEFMTDHISLFGNACLDCHDGIETYGTDFDHNRLAFKLEYLHAFLNCAECHAGATSIQMLKDTPQACESCHQKDDVHSDQMGNQCGVCHTPKGWEFGIFDHGATGFLLIGGHDKLECLNCHQDTTYQGIDPACVTCHAQDEPHNGQFGFECGACHTIERWDQIVFDHSGTIAENCNSCHLVDQPANHYSGQCSACHSTNAWLPATFDHNAAGATDCISCHNGNKPANHYSGQCSACHSTSAWLPATFDHSAAGATDCISCHSGNKPANHFSGQCSTCHNTNAWKPASFSHSFPLNHGGANQQCQLCHTNNNYNAYTCYDCHEHNQAKMQEEHREVNNFSNNCIACHPGGREAEGDD